MNDFELFDALCRAEQEYNRLNDEFRRRGLHKKPYCEYSKFPPGPDERSEVKTVKSGAVGGER